MATRGRPRAFDLEAALDAAIEVFWRQGYASTTLEELTARMGISKPSLYAAWGDKEGLFEASVRRYAATTMAYVGEALAKPTAWEVAEHYLLSNADAITQPSCPPGCLSVQAGLAAGPGAEEAVEFLAASRNQSERLFVDRFQEAIDEGDLPADESAEDLACLIVAASGGMAIEASSGASRAKLRRIARRFLACFPAPVSATLCLATDLPTSPKEGRSG